MKKLTPLSLLIHTVMFLLALSWLYPFVWMVISSLKPTAEIYTTSLFSGHLTLGNYAFLFDNSQRADKPFLRTLCNSLFVSVTITASVTVTSMLVGYALAKTEFRGKKRVSQFAHCADGIPGLYVHHSTVCTDAGTGAD
ncbi:ABC-type maltose transport systems, permease component [Kluyvera cryocrescens]|uniref:ABC-type maltose transport systems, permease component n=1 Tax=Kluyvera cryocrescens TaxID=580 RepID=A0A485AUR4_KLUCR|nr:ABC-type maltose transport systems, permease component [Kluyvera cryocrescens]